MSGSGVYEDSSSAHEQGSKELTAACTGMVPHVVIDVDQRTIPSHHPTTRPFVVNVATKMKSVLPNRSLSGPTLVEKLESPLMWDEVWLIIYRSLLSASKSVTPVNAVSNWAGV